MEKISVAIKTTAEYRDLPLPHYQSEKAAGMDLYACIEKPIVLSCGKRALVPCGIHISLPDGFEAQVRPRSGLAAKHGVTVLNSPGTIDSDYRGEIQTILINVSDSDFTISRGDRIAQMIISKVDQVVWDLKENLDETKRGHDGFGSTGKEVKR